jgi:hypothetical protein
VQLCRRDGTLLAAAREVIFFEERKRGGVRRCCWLATLDHRQFAYNRPTHCRGGTAMIGSVLSNGRLLSLQAVEWMMLLGGGLAGAVILML